MFDSEGLLSFTVGGAGRGDELDLLVWALGVFDLLVEAGSPELLGSAVVLSFPVGKAAREGKAILVVLITRAVELLEDEGPAELFGNPDTFRPSAGRVG